MRVLLLENEETSNYEVMEIIDIGYEESILCGNAEDAKRQGLPVISGLYLVDTEGCYFYIEGVSPKTINTICLKLAESGWADLRQFGTYEYENWYTDKYLPDDEKRGSREVSKLAPYYVAAMPQEIQEEIKAKVIVALTACDECTQENVESAMNSKIYDLSDLIDIKKYVDLLENRDSEGMPGLNAF